jgi:hypothetical protein
MAHYKLVGVDTTKRRVIVPMRARSPVVQDLNDDEGQKGPAPRTSPLPVSITD